MDLCFHERNNRDSLQARLMEEIDLFTDTAAILNSIVLTEKLWAAEGAIAGKFIVYTAFRINFYCLSLIFHNITIFGSCSYGYRKIIVKSYHATVFFLIISHLPPGHPIISSEFKMAAVSVKRSIAYLIK